MYFDIKVKIILLLLTLAAIAYSYVGDAERFIWWREALPVFFGLVMLIIYRMFDFTQLVYKVIFIHFLILLLGAHYTYAKVPGFDWMKGIFQYERNNYDKIGHFIQGFSPALNAREILVRNAVVKGKGWLFLIFISVVLAISAFYELIEWWVSLLFGDSGGIFLGTHEYIWDTQNDIFLALICGLVSLIFLSKFQDSLICKIE